MGFDLPVALLGLLAAGIPVLAHLVRRRDLPTVSLPTVKLLSRATAQSRRRLALRDLLLLLARIGLVVLMALAVARPYSSASLAAGDGRVAALGIVLDDSMSMGASLEGGVAFETAREAAIDAVRALPPGSEVAVALGGRPPRLLTPRGTNPDDAVRALRSLPPPGARGTDLASAVSVALRQVEDSALAARRLLVVSDFTSAAMSADMVWPTDGVETQLLRVGETAPSNRSLVEALVAPEGESGGWVVRATVRTTFPEDEVRVRVVREGEVLVDARLPVGRGRATGTLRVPEVPEGASAVAWVEVEGSDALPMDDRRPLLLRPPGGVRVVLVDGDPHPDRARDEVGFLARALDAAPHGTLPVGYRVVDPETLTAEVLAEADVVVLAHLSTPSSSLARRLDSYVREGGGLLVTPGEHFSSPGHASELRDLLPAHPNAASSPGAEATLRARAADLLPDGTRLDTVRVRRRLVLEPRPDAAVALELSDHTPVLVLGTHGRGRTAMLATSLDADWSDLPYHPAFVALSVELLRRLAGDAPRAPGPFCPGDPIPLPRTSGLGVVDPDGVEHAVQNGAESSYRADAKLGVYAVLAEGRPLATASFAVVPPPEEGILDRAPLPELPAAGSNRLSVPTGTTLRRPLAPLLFLLAALLAILEGILRGPPLRSARRNDARR